VASTWRETPRSACNSGTEYAARRPAIPPTTTWVSPISAKPT
jgi:hypothetical protein